VRALLQPFLDRVLGEQRRGGRRAAGAPPD
jgi:hypothetical protein